MVQAERIAETYWVFLIRRLSIDVALTFSTSSLPPYLFSLAVGNQCRSAKTIQNESAQGSHSRHLLSSFRPRPWTDAIIALSALRSIYRNVPAYFPLRYAELCHRPLVARKLRPGDSHSSGVLSIATDGPYTFVRATIFALVMRRSTGLPFVPSRTTCTLLYTRLGGSPPVDTFHNSIDDSMRIAWSRSLRCEVASLHLATSLRTSIRTAQFKPVSILQPF